MQTTMNGKHEVEPSVEKGLGEKYVLRNWYCKEGDGQYIRLLSDVIYGMKTHYVGKKGYACKGELCNPLHHKRDTTWRGYIAAERWDKADRKWFPICFEMSEAMELDFRHRLARGQTWFVWREPCSEGKKSPQQARYVPGKDSLEIPLAFDIRPVVQALYHLERLPPTVKNPQPDRVIVGASDGPDPDEGREDVVIDAQMSLEELNEFNRIRDERMKEAKRRSDEYSKRFKR